MTLKLTPSKFPFVAGEVAVAVWMAKHAWTFRELWYVVLGSGGVCILALGCAMFILLEENGDNGSPGRPNYV